MYRRSKKKAAHNATLFQNALTHLVSKLKIATVVTSERI